VARAWLRDELAHGANRVPLAAIVGFADARLKAGDLSAETFSRASQMFCAACRDIHPDLARGCPQTAVPDLTQCWLTGLLPTSLWLAPAQAVKRTALRLNNS
jgi:hypothetical protein